MHGRSRSIDVTSFAGLRCLVSSRFVKGLFHANGDMDYENALTNEWYTYWYSYTAPLEPLSFLLENPENLNSISSLEYQMYNMVK